MPDRLRDYKTKRDFGATPEPRAAKSEARAPGRAPSMGGEPLPRFVVQEHHATRLHWDLRLEHDGALASWAIPNGLPEEPKVNRKAVRTEDHPLDYLDFEGEIPPGSYGAGTMRVWDRGVYEVEKWRADEVIAVFHGERISGRYALFRAGEERDWLIHRMDPPADPAREPLPKDIVPMLARPGPLPRDEQHWAYEIKWDGVRAIAYVTPGELRLQSRNLRDVTRSYPELRALARELGSRSAVLDGEIVALDDQGRPSFARLQERMHVESESSARRRAEHTPVIYMIFDLLYFDGRSLMHEPYSQRRLRLDELGLSGSSWQTPATHHGDGTALLSATAEQGLEGLVAKRLESPYEPGRRSGAWLKVKNTRSRELVIGGWVGGAGRRRGRLGALLLGHYDPEGRLIYAGRVGTGFSERTLKELGRQLAALARSDSPFAAHRLLPRDAHYVEPRLVAEVEFSEWTAEGQLRHPSFKGLRDDKDAREVVREDPLAPQSDGACSDGSASPGARAVRPATRRRRAPGSGRSPAPAGPESIFDSVAPSPNGLEVVLEGRRLRLSNYEKVLFPQTGFTKGDLIEYYARVAPAMLPHLRDRPVTLKRYPDGVVGQFFYEKNCPTHRPEWVQTVAVGGGRGSGPINYCVIADAPTLVWAANLAAIELHTSLARVPQLDRSTTMVFDLDPGPPADLLQCCEVALVLQRLFDGLGLLSAAKTSGSKGLQVYVPLNRDVEFSATKAFSRKVAELLAAQAPGLVVSRMTRSLRSGRVLVDWSQNDRAKTTVNVYSVRAQPQPTVSAPVSWQEVKAAHDSGDLQPLVFTAATVLERLARDGDLFADVLTVEQELPPL